MDCILFGFDFLLHIYYDNEIIWLKSANAMLSEYCERLSRENVYVERIKDYPYCFHFLYHVEYVQYVDRAIYSAIVSDIQKLSQRWLTHARYIFVFVKFEVTLSIRRLSSLLILSVRNNIAMLSLCV